MNSATTRLIALSAAMASAVPLGNAQIAASEATPQPHDVMGKVSLISMTEVDIQTAAGPANGTIMFERNSQTRCPGVRKGDLVWVVYIEVGSKKMARVVTPAGGAPDNKSSSEHLGVATLLQEDKSGRSVASIGPGGELPAINRPLRVLILTSALQKGDNLSSENQSAARTKLASALVGSTILGLKVEVVDDRSIEPLLREQALSNSDRLDGDSRLKLARVAGVDAILMMSGKESEKQIGSPMANMIGPSRGVFEKQVDLSAHLIYPVDGRTMLAVEGRGEELTRGSNRVIPGIGKEGQQTETALDRAVIDMTQSLRRATPGSVVAQDSSQQVHSVAATAAPAAQIPYETMIADATGKTLILGAGTNNGVRIGDLVVVYRDERVVTDPSTGPISKLNRLEVGKAVITQVDARSSSAILLGDGKAQVTDRVVHLPK